MNIGKLDRLITLQAPATVPQAPNGELAPKAFTDVEAVWAGIYYAPGNEAVQAGELTATQRILFTIRYRADVRPTWQLMHEGRTFQITDVAEIGCRQGLKLTCYSHG
ncbi:SPP1 family predicted phage head-tail adaptor [Hymenobacter sp. UYAg731]